LACERRCSAKQGPARTLLIGLVPLWNGFIGPRPRAPPRPALDREAIRNDDSGAKLRAAGRRLPRVNHQPRPSTSRWT
jgi:hypothetical protein